ncbi:MAG: helix-turn-helix transcriptional regulator [Flexilinea sp.]|nr:helix-turn-helix transcriptional regulator [Flexilinea sp.]
MNIIVSVENGGLKRNRELSGMSVEQLAEKAGLAPEMIREYEDGSRDLNRVDLLTLLKLANTLHCPLTALLTDPATLAELEKYENDDDDAPIPDPAADSSAQIAAIRKLTQELTE